MSKVSEVVRQQITYRRIGRRESLAGTCAESIALCDQESTVNLILIIDLNI